jgi:hypothetical protein
MDKEYTNIMTQAMYGQDARHVAFNVVLQDQGEGKAAIVGTTSFAKTMGYGFKKNHCLLLCDVIIRPHLVIESNHLRGVGLAGIVTSSSMSGVSEWVRKGNILVNNLPSRLKE